MRYGNLTGKIAIITGAARGIGQAAAQVLAAYGATVIIADLNYDSAVKTANELIADGLSAFAAKVDVMEKDSIQAMINTVVEKYGTIDILVNNAGILDATPIPEMSVENWDKVIDIDLRGTHLCSQLCLPHMMKNNYGKIINIASQAGQLGGFLAGVNYTAAKGGVIALTKAYARYCAQYNITVNCVSPGFIATEMTQSRNDNADTVPLKRLGTALDVAKSIYFLASDLSDYITGSSIDVNGGYLMR
ncbi:SDR family NAD(P)-dependent oxidoreductase [Petroclostridium sp. X23]|uniref:SDR family NAD(P)-dependent oxidoreductase n=1 Tax=Petroclostridium sp. X23 TaxID=3045146 RepID=UPI0024ACD73D|nr:SDR family NAD(P)-dependent oxidoreductase [Petroclostridium sp. X23]WHH57026.1 SDR family NAD(P)-dependent oxidoreductase [Petroclostridium sp. X23]